MGCTVTQTATETTVEGPASGGLQPVAVDMSNVTDTFMTAAVLMATCPPGTKSQVGAVRMGHLDLCL